MCRPPPSFSLLALAIVAALVRPAEAEESAKPDDRVTEYRETVVRAVDLFNGGRYDEARRAFRRAYRIHPDPVLLFNIGSTYRREGDAPRALELYRRFLDRAPRDEPRRAIAKETIADLERRIAEERAAARAGDRPAPAADSADSAETAAAPVTFAGQGRRDAGEPEDPGRTLRWSGLATAAVGVAGLGAAWFEWRRARDAEETIESLPPGTPWGDREAAVDREGRASHQRSQWLAWAGGALVATGAVLYAVGVHRDSDDDTLDVGLTASGGSAGVMVRGSF